MAQKSSIRLGIKGMTCQGCADTISRYPLLDYQEAFQPKGLSELKVIFDMNL